MPNVIEIVKLTAKNNCKKCGFPTCMAFAVSVSAGNSDISLCPYIDAPKSVKVVSPVDSDSLLLKDLKARAKSADLQALADGLGAGLVYYKGMPALHLSYLGSKITLSSDVIADESGKELDPRDQILLYNYLFFAGKGALSGTWVGLESLPNSISKVTTLRRYAEGRIASFFAGKKEQLESACLSINAMPFPDCHADLCMIVPVLPKVPMLLFFWDEDKDEGFESRVKMAFDAKIMVFLDLESIVFAAEKMAEKLEEMSRYYGA